jgi:hypothetical protein
MRSLETTLPTLSFDVAVCESTELESPLLATIVAIGVIVMYSTPAY